MSTVFYIKDILNFAVEREQESYVLYRELSEKVERQELKETFRTLMGEEKKHQELYSRLLSSVDQKQTPGKGYESYNDYMKTLIEEQRSVKKPPVDMNNIQEVLDFAIAREKDAVLFYAGLENYVPQDYQDSVKAIIMEEGSHIVKLSNMKKELAS